ncbi:MAG: CRTAC1 family protein [Planctomycetota bacterium]
MVRRLTTALLALLAVACSADPEPPTPLPDGFVDRGPGSGVDFVNHTGVYDEKPWLFLSKGGGVLVLDYDTDGDVDLYCVDGNDIVTGEGGTILSRTANPDAGNRLYRNDGGWRFVDVTEAAGVGDTAFGVAGAVGDYDNDGDPDLYVCNWGRNRLYRNDGGTFTDVAEAAGVTGDEELFSTCAAFLDADADGDLDLYVSNYGDIGKLLKDTQGEPPGMEIEGIWRFDGPGCYAAQKDLLFENLGDGRFRDVSAERLEGQVASYGFQPIPFDADNDGDTDLYVANDSRPNFLWLNDGTGRFTDRAMSTGAALAGDMYAQAGMGVDAADYDQDGWMDLVVTNFANDQNTLYRNWGATGRFGFVDVSHRAGLAVSTFPHVSWGVAFRDFDQDGVLDLFFANGHVYPTPDPETAFQGSRYEQAPSLFFGTGAPEWKFRAAGATAGPAFRKRGLGRAAAFADFDDDGDPDVAIACLNQPLRLIENRLSNQGNWIRLKLRGTRSNRDGIGARVKVVAGGRTQVRDFSLAGSFGASQDPRMHFGVGRAGRVDVVVRWPRGRVVRVEGLASNRVQELVEPRD